MSKLNVCGLGSETIKMYNSQTWGSHPVANQRLETVILEILSFFLHIRPWDSQELNIQFAYSRLVILTVYQTYKRFFSNHGIYVCMRLDNSVGVSDLVSGWTTARVILYMKYIIFNKSIIYYFFTTIWSADLRLETCIRAGERLDHYQGHYTGKQRSAPAEKKRH